MVKPSYFPDRHRVTLATILPTLTEMLLKNHELRFLKLLALLHQRDLSQGKVN